MSNSRGTSSFRLLAFISVAGVALVGCQMQVADDGTGGSSGTGASSSSGAASGSGGAEASGGASASGAATGSGGADATGGMASGGGETGGAASGGGTSGSGGVASGGGSPSSGGAGGGNTGGTSAGGTGGTSSLVTPIDRGSGSYVLEFGDIFFEVDASTGGRIVTFSLGGTNVLISPDIQADNYGSTLTLSPQADSGWPPPEPLDTGPYDVTVDGNEVTMTSGSATVAGGDVRAIKEFTPLLAQRAIRITYTLENTGTADITWAPWEISRVASSGLTFFATGEFEIELDMNPLNDLIEKQDSWTWYQSNPDDVAAATDSYGLKYLADGSGGWMGHVTPDDILFFKTFPDLAPEEQPTEDNEAEIAIYEANPDDYGRSYVEIEPQGPYTTLAAGETLSWTVTWYLRALPSDAEPVVGNAELMSFVESLLE